MLYFQEPTTTCLKRFGQILFGVEGRTYISRALKSAGDPSLQVHGDNLILSQKFLGPRKEGDHVKACLVITAKDILVFVEGKSDLKFVIEDSLQNMHDVLSFIYLWQTTMKLKKGLFIENLAKHKWCFSKHYGKEDVTRFYRSHSRFCSINDMLEVKGMLTETERFTLNVDSCSILEIADVTENRFTRNNGFVEVVDDLLAKGVGLILTFHEPILKKIFKLFSSQVSASLLFRRVLFVLLLLHEALFSDEWFRTLKTLSVSESCNLLHTYASSRPTKWNCSWVMLYLMSCSVLNISPQGISSNAMFTEILSNVSRRFIQVKVVSPCWYVHFETT
ncbi:hypothetical protein NCAS_0B03170 [Naumovozyma castellii]|uniref:Uncharacterized protein n=1 Tax=Naumovozyma castellii TaxID=27288 RepID=G0VBS5_NAUCA|nr:hypothetical protein NCAS_0B03170 [Naumovozyma castellii CBS 4309]CCC68401.1 hypothetical protein NCAS_0B03170 [Naumovozyma castellii CBS 4309]